MRLVFTGLYLYNRKKATGKPVLVIDDLTQQEMFIQRKRKKLISTSRVLIFSILTIPRLGIILHGL